MMLLLGVLMKSQEILKLRRLTARVRELMIVFHCAWLIQGPPLYIKEGVIANRTLTIQMLLRLQLGLVKIVVHQQPPPRLQH